MALKFQKLDYPFEPVAMVQKYLSKIRMPEEQDIYEVSIKREKKGEEDKAASSTFSLIRTHAPIRNTELTHLFSHGGDTL